ncbi:MAG: hypothetical protein U5L01_01005 [Rheinheimera sp.]|nr:hypothetical protein [Rheinheimera sp.]
MRDNAGAGRITATVEGGQGGSVPPNEFLITFTAPDQFKMEVLDNEGKVVTGSAITQTVTGYPMTFNTGNVGGGFLYGYEVTLDDTAGAFGDGDQFVLKPLSIAAQSLTLINDRPEDLALASPVRGEFTINNQGNARFGDFKVTDTDPLTSAFTSPGGITGAPLSVTYIGEIIS